MKFGNHEVTVFPGSSPEAPLILLNTFEGEGHKVYEEVQKLTKADFHLAAIRIENWGDEMTPWPEPPVAKGMEDCGGQADAFLDELERDILPGVLADQNLHPAWIGIAGYSLAGLCALYALHSKVLFNRCASASGSMWYPGFLEYCREHEPGVRPDRVYLSLGDKEARTRNPVMGKVQENTEALLAWYQEQGYPVKYELNPGNHFVDAAVRMAKGIAWMLEE